MAVTKENIDIFIKVLKEALEACKYIEASGGCDNCPLASDCLLNGFDIGTAYASDEKWKEFFDFGDDVDRFLAELELSKSDWHRQQLEENELFWQQYSDSVDREEEWNA